LFSQKHQCATKTLGIWTLPPILVIHLHRFKTDGERRSKIDTVVDFPIEGLDMS
jgi:ubiquitin C-terminal hydrolase